MRNASTVCQHTTREAQRCHFSLGKMYFRIRNVSCFAPLPILCIVLSEWMSWASMVKMESCNKKTGLRISNLSNNGVDNFDQTFYWEQQYPILLKNTDVENSEKPLANLIQKNMTRVIYHDYVTCVCLLYSTIKYFKWWAWIKTWMWSLIPQPTCFISLSKIYLRLIFIISEVRVKTLLWSALVRMKWSNSHKTPIMVPDWPGKYYFPPRLQPLHYWRKYSYSRLRIKLCHSHCSFFKFSLLVRHCWLLGTQSSPTQNFLFILHITAWAGSSDPGARCVWGG